jgi:alkylation response protein AidB-like acyl-CoA dehydrogenase
MPPASLCGKNKEADVKDHPLLSEEQRERYLGFCQYAQEHAAALDREWDSARGVPREVIEQCARAGYVGGLIPSEHGGGGWDAVTFGLLNEALGAASSALCALFTVQNMVAMPLVKWGSEAQQKQWLEPMARGKVIASFAMTEPRVGSDIQAVETTYTPKGGGYLLNGTKKWITYSAMADIFLVFGKDTDGKAIAAIVRSDAPGVEVHPLKDMMGFRAAHLSRLEFKDVEIAPEDLVGKPGFALTYVASYGLHYGRISTAWSSAGLLRACLETAASYTQERKVFGTLLMDQGMIRQLVTDMGVNLEASQHLCLAAAMADDSHSPRAMEKTLMAKYFASRAAVRAAADTVQILGAAGCHEDSPAARYYRNSKIMEIIEGTNQVQQTILGKNFCRRFGGKKNK